jgi:ketosteroid isomerase-like protein
MIRALSFTISIALFATACSGPGLSSNADIEAVLSAQAEAWNRGDIPAFMETYIKSEELRFASGGSVQRGWQNTLERYRKRYPTPEAMGRLAFEDLETKRLADGWAEVHGRYRLYREGDYGNATGLFTLLMQKTTDGWKILHDHTSAE